MSAKPAFKAKPVTISIPATSANLGPGFDALGLALDIRDVIAAQVLDEKGLDVEIAGEGSEDLRKDAKHLVVKSMYEAFDAMGGRPRGLAIRCANAIPHSRGLGSSAAAIVGGMALARALVLSGNERLPDEAVLNLATKQEGHPDNVAAALYGGATIAWMDGERAKSTRLTPHPSISAVAFVPQSALSTSKARKLLPENIPHRDAVISAGRAALLVEALTHHPEFLFDATQDLLHQEYRREAMPRSLALMKKLRGAGHAAFISGAGPTVLVLTAEAGADWASFGGTTFESRDVAISNAGPQVFDN